MNNRFLQIWISLLHIGAFVFFYFYNFEPEWISYLGQVFSVLSFVLIVSAYSKFVRRLQPFRLGLGLMRNQDFSTKLLKTGNKHVDQAIELFNSMLEQLKKEKTERAEQEQFRNLLIEASPLGVIVLDFNQQVASINPAALEILQVNKEQVAGSKVNALKSEVGKELTQLKLNEKKLIRLQMQQQYRLTKGSMIDRGHERYFFIIEELTADIHQAEKNAWEKLIRVMAHEVNNTVGSVNSILSSLGELFPNKDEKEILSVAQNRNASLAQFINQYASIVKLEKPQKNELSVKDIVTSVAKFFHPALEKNSVKLEISGEDFSIMGDQSQLEQVLQNIIQNAIDSFKNETKHDRLIDIKLQKERLELKIINNGEPIPDNIKPHLFSPFYTTKADGNGIGLMLASEILQKHNCKYSLTSDDSITIFDIRFSSN